jgi:hypothetical protein
VFGHHPVHSVNGFSGDYQREISPENGRKLWDILVRNRVMAYMCSHILAYDVQVHEGILQILSGGAGTMPRMPEDIEYLHAVQAALDINGLRWQVLDTSGEIREWLKWPIEVPQSVEWKKFETGEIQSADSKDNALSARFAVWRFTGISADSASGAPQTIISGWNTDKFLAPLWIGLRGNKQRLCVLLSRKPGRSPHLWLGPELLPNIHFDMQFAIHTGMGPGGLLWRRDDKSLWSSLKAASPWGAETFDWPKHWSIGHGQHGPDDAPFRGSNLEVTGYTKILSLSDIFSP